jgi:hypothetical protein
LTAGRSRDGGRTRGGSHKLAYRVGRGKSQRGVKLKHLAIKIGDQPAALLCCPCVAQSTAGRHKIPI